MEENVNISGFTKIERYFDQSSSTAFEEIVNSFVMGEIDLIIESSYYHDTVNAATSDEGVA